MTSVAFYNGASLIGTATSAPYTTNWTQVPAGSYSLTAVATDNQTVTTTSAPVNITVQAAPAGAPAGLYFIHPDHLNTPRIITNQAGRVVWAWDNTDPFGNNTPNENPNGAGQFTCNLRLPGQYFDKETNLHYNYFRDYDPAIGRYVQSDPIGLMGGINTYTYVGGNPISRRDPKGLIDNDFSDLTRPSGSDGEEKLPGNPGSPKATCIAQCLAKSASKAVVVSGATYAAAYAAVLLLAPEVTVPATIIIVAGKQRYGIYYITAKIVYTLNDCTKQCDSCR